MTATVVVGQEDHSTLLHLRSVLAEFGIDVRMCVLPDFTRPTVAEYPISGILSIVSGAAIDGLLTVVCCPVPIVSPLGFRLAGVCEGTVIMISSRVTEPSDIARVLRHELGHYFGLREHLDCVMSPYFTEFLGFCHSCRQYLAEIGIRWSCSSAFVSQEAGRLRR
jgi:hypothetical protein